MDKSIERHNFIVYSFKKIHIVRPSDLERLRFALTEMIVKTVLITPAPIVAKMGSATPALLKISVE